MSIRFKLYMALFAAVFLVALSLLFFLQYSVGSFESYVREQDARMLQQVATRLEERYADHEGETWQFVDTDLESWLREENLFGRRRPFPETSQNGLSDPLASPRASSSQSQPFRAPPSRGDIDNEGFGRPQGFESKLVLRNVQGDYVAGTTQELGVSQSVDLEFSGELVGRLELLESGEQEGSFGVFGRPPFSDGFPPAPTASNGYVSDLVSRSRFMNLQTRIFIILVFASMVVLLLLGVPLTRYFTNRVDAINTAAERLSKGDYATRVVPSSRDELGQLAQRFNYLAEVLQRNKQSQQMWVSNISHELRTPLGILKGELEAVQDGLRTADTEHINMLCNEVEQLSTLIDDLFELSMSDLGGLAYNNENVQIAQIVEDSISRFKDQISDHGLSLQLSIDTPEELWVFGDRQRLLQLFSNLIQNSIKYTRAGGILHVGLALRGGRVLVTVEDSAPGVPVELLERLFERFFRVEESRNRSTGGAGLGLAICKSIVESHRGDIRATQSSLGGVLIELSLPKVKNI